MKKAYIAGIFALISAATTPTAYAAGVSDKEANAIAKRMLGAIDHAKKTAQQAIETGDRDGYFKYGAAQLRKEIQGWPDMTLQNKAIFPYQQCHQAGLDFIDLADTYFAFKDSVRNRQHRDYVEKQFAKTYLDCKSSIKKPDMSLKDIR